MFILNKNPRDLLCRCVPGEHGNIKTFIIGINKDLRLFKNKKK